MINDKDIWAEIDAIFVLPARQAGDLDTHQFVCKYGGTETSARRRMEKLVATGDWQFVLVADETSTTKKRKIIRKTKL